MDTDTQPIQQGTFTALLALALVALVPTLGAQDQEASPAGPAILIKAERVIIRPGKEVSDTQVLVQGGKVLAVGKDLEAPEGAKVFESKVGLRRLH